MKDEKLMAHDPLADADAILSEEFYGRPRLRDGDQPPRRMARGTMELQPASRAPTAPRPSHYKVLCISMYNQDIEEMDAKVAELKRRGWTKANRSQLIRLALARLDVDALTTPRQ